MRESASTALALYEPADAAMRELREEYLAFARPEASTSREASPEQHLTVGGFVFSPDRSRVLLCFHRKGRFWVQFGGHVEPADPSLAEAALRESAEESGLRDLLPLAEGRPVDLDRHALPSSFGACRVHWDVGFAFEGDPQASPEVSDESEDVAWWPVDALPDGAVPDLENRVRRALAAL